VSAGRVSSHWDVKVEPEIIYGHGGLWHPNAQAMMAAIFRMNFPLQLGGHREAGEQTQARRKPSVGTEHVKSREPASAPPPAPLRTAPQPSPADLQRKPDLQRMQSPLLQ
jgi:hypothetical protein